MHVSLEATQVYCAIRQHTRCRQIGRLGRESGCQRILHMPVYNPPSLIVSKSNAAVTCKCPAHLAVQLLCQAAGLPLHGRHLISQSVISRGSFRWRAIALLSNSHSCCQLSLLYFQSLPQSLIVLLSCSSRDHQQLIDMQCKTLSNVCCHLLC